MSRYLSFFVLTLATATSAARLSADTIRLDGGRTIRGQILDEKSTSDSLVVKLQVGNGEVTVARSQIQEVIRENDPVDEYAATKEKYQDTAEDQYALAMWCEAHKLPKQKRLHLLRVIELDPEHVQAHEKLGYVKRDGKWLTPTELKEAKGLVKFGGRYVTPQEKEILEQKKRQDDEEKEWHARVKMWKGWMTGNDPTKARLGEERLRSIDDPQAIEALVGHLGKDNAESIRILMCSILGNIAGDQATMELLKRCIIDVSPSVRWAAVDALAEREDPQATRSLASLLKSEHNTLIRRAADALGALGDASAVPPLIDALVTKHKQVITRQGGTSFIGTQSPTVIDYEPVVAPGVVAFRPVIGYQAQGVGISAPSQEVVTVQVENDEVRHALVQLTKEDFGYNQTAWRAWLANQRKKDELKNRR
jgi:HEAT repeats